MKLNGLKMSLVAAVLVPVCGMASTDGFGQLNWSVKNNVKGQMSQLTLMGGDIAAYNKGHG